LKNKTDPSIKEHDDEDVYLGERSAEMTKRR